MQAVATIGVYGFTARTFLDALHTADVRRLLDVRQRRGMRGPDYGVGELSTPADIAG